MKFKELGLSHELLKAIEKQEYVEATPIQEAAIPHILNNRDIVGIAQTGTGKTAAFSLPILEKLIKDNKPNRKIKVLILSPTRELAIQIRDNIRSYSSETSFKCSVILGGVNQNSQIEVLKTGVDILVATPGRLLDLIHQRKANLSNVEMLVLDEADTMLDMGFIKDVKEIVSNVPKNRQTLLFSATMPKEIRDLTNMFLVDPITVSITPESTTVDRIKQLLYYVDTKNKFSLLLDLLNNNMKTTLIFTRTKRGANQLGEKLSKMNIKSSIIHGNKAQNARVKALDDFKLGKTNILIATDIAARGIDINELSHVVNYDVPEHPELYVHRIGRTARAGLDGVSITLCSFDEMKKLQGIERLIKQHLEVVDHKYPMIDLVEKEKPKTNNSKSNFDRNRTGKSNNFNTNRNNNSNNKSSKNFRGSRNYK